MTNVPVTEVLSQERLRTFGLSTSTLLDTGGGVYELDTPTTAAQWEIIQELIEWAKTREYIHTIIIRHESKLCVVYHRPRTRVSDIRVTYDELDADGTSGVYMLHFGPISVPLSREDLQHTYDVIATFLDTVNPSGDGGLVEEMKQNDWHSTDY